VQRKVDIIVVTRKSRKYYGEVCDYWYGTWAGDGNEADTWDRGSLRERAPGLASQWGWHLIRPAGWNTWLTFSISPMAPTSTVAPTHRIVTK